MEFKGFLLPERFSQALHYSGRMSLRSYLTGVAPFTVPDILPGGGKAIEVLLILESPHVDELKTGIPLSGIAGHAAFSYLFPKTASSSPLGPFIADLHSNGDGRVAIVNASPVPLQKAAFKDHPFTPALSQPEWELLEKARTNRANAISGIRRTAVADVNKEILYTLQRRVDTLHVKEDVLIVPAGRFAQRTWHSIAIPSSWSRWRLLPVLHPANNWWARTKNQNEILRLKMLEYAFGQATA